MPQTQRDRASFEIDNEIAFEINALKREACRRSQLHGTGPVCVGARSREDSQGCRISAQTDADIILFCGVKFMAETAQIVREDGAGPLEAGVRSRQESRWMMSCASKTLPGVPVVRYVNTPTSRPNRIIVASGNADKVVKHVLDKGHETKYFLPDEYLARNAAADMGLPITVIEKTRTARRLCLKEPTSPRG
jgi:quinolinate synthase